MATAGTGSGSSGGAIGYDVWVGLVVAILVLAAVSLLSLLLTALEEWASHHRHVAEILRRAFKETTLLGIVALVLFVIEQAHAIEGVALTELQYLHTALFAIVAVYILFISTMLVLSRRIGHGWRRMEDTYVSDFRRYKALREELYADQRTLRIAHPGSEFEPSVADAGGGDNGGRSPESAAPGFAPAGTASLLRALLAHPLVAARYYRRLGAARYLEQRQRFLVRHADILPPDFAFASYLTLCKQHVFVRLADVHPLLWVGLAWLLTVDLYLRSVWPWYRGAFTGTPVVFALSAAAVTLAAAVLAKVRNVHWHVIHSEFASIQVRQATVAAAESWDEIAASLSLRSFASFRDLAAGATPAQRRVAAADADAIGGGGLSFRGVSPSVGGGGGGRAPLTHAPPVPLPGDRRHHQHPPPHHRPSVTQMVPILAGGGPGGGGAEGGEGDGEVVLVPAAEAAAHGRMPTLFAPRAEVAVTALDDAAYREMHRRHLREQLRLFWFGKPLFVLSLLQLVFFLVSLSVALVVILWRDVTSSLTDILVCFLSLATALVTSVALLSSVVPLYVLSIHTSDLVDAKLLAEAVVRHERHKRRAARLEAEQRGIAPADAAALAAQRKRHVWLRVRLAVAAAAVTATLARRPGEPRAEWAHRVRAAALWATTIHTTRQAVTLLLLLEIFLIAVLYAPYISSARGVIRAFIIAVAALVACELALRVWATGGVAAFFAPRAPQFPWNVLDALTVAAAIVAAVVESLQLGPQAAPGATVTASPLYLGALTALHVLREPLGAVTHAPPPPPPALKPTTPAAGAETGEGRAGGDGGGDTTIRRLPSYAYAPPPSVYGGGGGGGGFDGGYLGARSLGRIILGEGPPPSVRIHAPRPRPVEGAAGAAGAVVAAGPARQDADRRGSRRRAGLPREFLTPRPTPTPAPPQPPQQQELQLVAAALTATDVTAPPSPPVGVPDVSAAVLAPIEEEQVMIDERLVETALERAEEGQPPPPTPAVTATQQLPYRLPPGSDTGSVAYAAGGEAAAELTPADDEDEAEVASALGLESARDEGDGEPPLPAELALALQVARAHGEAAGTTSEEGAVDEHATALEAFGLHRINAGGVGGGGRPHVHVSSELEAAQQTHEVLSELRRMRARAWQRGGGGGYRQAVQPAGEGSVLAAVDQRVRAPSPAAAQHGGEPRAPTGSSEP